MEIVDDRLGGGHVTAGRVQDQVEALLAIQLVRARHESRLVRIGDAEVDARVLANVRLVQPPGVVSEDVPTSVRVKLSEILQSDVVMRALTVGLKLREYII